MSRDGVHAIAADPDFDRVYIAALSGDPVVRRVELSPDDEPGRLVEDGAGRVHVALRRGGAVVTINVTTGAITERRAVCPAPRGIAWSESGDVLHVACAGGELVTMPAAGGAPTRTLWLQRDLRDVVVVGSELWVSRFRSAEVLVVGAAGDVVRTMRPSWGTAGSEAGVAWRMVNYGQGAVMVHQRAGVAPLMPSPPSPGAPAYQVRQDPSDTCATGMTPGEFTVFMPDAPPVTSQSISRAVLPVDITPLAANPRTGVQSSFLIASPGTADAAEQTINAQLSGSSSSTRCVGVPDMISGTGQRVAVAALPLGEYVVQMREPPSLYVSTSTRVISLSEDRRNDFGHSLFHTSTSVHLACASCHPDGSDDGHAWRLQGKGLRRTPDLRGGILGTAPFHWDGALATMDHLVDEVMVRRMGHSAVSHAEVVAMAHWLDALPLPARSAPTDREAVARGDALFHRTDVGCAGCHSGPLFTNNVTVDVGTGAAFQVPSLRGVAGRAPYMHDGCAATLRDRFGRCGGGESHGHVAQLGPGEIDDLVAYLETL